MSQQKTTKGTDIRKTVIDNNCEADVDLLMIISVTIDSTLSMTGK